MTDSDKLLHDVEAARRSRDRRNCLLCQHFRFREGGAIIGCDLRDRFGHSLVGAMGAPQLPFDPDNLPSYLRHSCSRRAHNCADFEGYPEDGFVEEAVA